MGSRERKRIQAEQEIEFADSYSISADEARSRSRGATPLDHAPDCLCTICTCGAHRCPPDRLQGRYTNLKSEHQAQFTGQYVPPTRPQKEKYVHQNRPFVATTTNQDDYCYWGAAAPRQPAEGARRVNDVFGNSNLPFEGVTTNQHDFRRWAGHKAAHSLKPHQKPVIVEDNRDFGTEVSIQYDYKNCQPRTSCAPTQTLSDPLPFEGRTTNNVDFVHHNVAPARSTQRQRTYSHRTEDRDWTTEARQQFVEKRFDPCPAKGLYTKTKDVNGHVTVERNNQTAKWQLTRSLRAMEGY